MAPNLWATEDQVSVGTRLIPDDGFFCMAAGVPRTVQQDNHGLFVGCQEGTHYLGGQLKEGRYVGFTLASAA